MFGGFDGTFRWCAKRDGCKLEMAEGKARMLTGFRVVLKLGERERRGCGGVNGASRIGQAVVCRDRPESSIQYTRRR